MLAFVFRRNNLNEVYVLLTMKGGKNILIYSFDMLLNEV